MYYFDNSPPSCVPLFSGERKLADDEKPLLVQLNWHRDDREGRFLLRRMDEETHVSFTPCQASLRRLSIFKSFRI